MTKVVKAPVDLVIFDCDGVLVDSEIITNTIFNEMLASVGIHVDMQYIFDNFVGKSMKTLKEQVRDLLGDEPHDEFYPEYFARCEQALRARLQAVAGVPAMLDAMTRPTCIASSGGHDKMQVTLGTTGLYERFEGRIFSATEVANGKPWPDIYLHAADRMGVATDRCVVIEDSSAGVTAGKRAGMRVVGYCERTPQASLVAAGADRVIRDMAELSSTIDALEAG